jgi:hypothetical protein
MARSGSKAQQAGTTDAGVEGLAVYRKRTASASGPRGVCESDRLAVVQELFGDRRRHAASIEFHRRQDAVLGSLQLKAVWQAGVGCCSETDHSRVRGRRHIAIGLARKRMVSWVTNN